MTGFKEELRALVQNNVNQWAQSKIQGGVEA